MACAPLTKLLFIFIAARVALFLILLLRAFTKREPDAIFRMAQHADRCALSILILSLLNASVLVSISLHNSGFSGRATTIHGLLLTSQCTSLSLAVVISIYLVGWMLRLLNRSAKT